MSPFPRRFRAAPRLLAALVLALALAGPALLPPQGAPGAGQRPWSGLSPIGQAQAGTPTWGAKHSSPADANATLAPGEWIWGGDSKALGPIAVIVSLTEQRAYVYRNGVLIGISTVSSGKPGYETPTGVFTILQKDADHRSSLYDSAPMPWQQRLTWDGVALHAGGLPGYPESHGCVHLPTEFARRLFEASDMGMVVVVSREEASPANLVHPRMLSPIDARTGEEVRVPALPDGTDYRWQPWLAPTGLLSIVVSRADRQAVVLRDGIEIGRTRIALADPARPLGTHAYLMKDGVTADNPLLPGRPLHDWMAIGIPGQDREAGTVLGPDAFRQVSVPRDFVEAVYAQLRPGAVLLLTDAPILPAQLQAERQILDAEPPPGR